MWFTEDPWPPLMVLAVLAVVLGLAWNATRRGMYLMAAVGMIVLGFVVLIAEELIVTESEVVEAQVLALADAVVEGDPDKLLSFFADDAERLKSEIRTRMNIIDVKQDLRITDLNVSLEPGETQAESHFRANGTVIVGNSITYTGPTRWNLTWRKEEGAWKVIQVERLDTVKGNVIDTWSDL